MLCCGSSRAHSSPPPPQVPAERVPNGTSLRSDSAPAKKLGNGAEVGLPSRSAPLTYMSEPGPSGVSRVHGSNDSGDHTDRNSPEETRMESVRVHSKAPSTSNGSPHVSAPEGQMKYNHASSSPSPAMSVSTMNVLSRKSPRQSPFQAAHSRGPSSNSFSRYQNSQDPNHHYPPMSPSSSYAYFQQEQQRWMEANGTRQPSLTKSINDTGATKSPSPAPLQTLPAGVARPAPTYATNSQEATRLFTSSPPPLSPVRQNFDNNPDHKKTSREMKSHSLSNGHGYPTPPPSSQSQMQFLTQDPTRGTTPSSPLKSPSPSSPRIRTQSGMSSRSITGPPRAPSAGSGLSHLHRSTFTSPSSIIPLPGDLGIPSPYNNPAARARSIGRSSSVATSAEGKLSVGIDFGTTFSGVAYGSTRVFAGQIRQILSWPGSYETYRKVPTCILYEQYSPQEEAKVVAWGLEAKNAPLRPGFIKCEWFKLLLSPEQLRSGVPDPRLPPLPYGKDVVDVISDFLRCLWRYGKVMITEEIGSVVDLDAADVLLTVPAAWDAAGCALMREAAIRAGLVQSSRGGDKSWRDRLRIITEPEAAAIHASTLSTLHHLRPSQTFIICDAGGGTVDTAVYKLMGQLSQLEIAEVCVRSGANCGSLFVDLKFEELLRTTLKDHPIHLDAPSLAAFMHAFSETDKLTYHGTAKDDQSLFRFNCFNVEDSHDPSIGLEFGELAIPGSVLKTEVFDPIIDQVLNLLALQISKVPDSRIDAIILVGGFAASEYLFTRVNETFGARIQVIARPNDCDVATLRGAARYGLGLSQGRAAVSNVISPRSYIMKVKLPAEDIDRMQRPQFITVNDAQMEVCENRLSYLVAKGSILRKGERLRSRFCKYVKAPPDFIFTAILYVSDSEEIYRYTDEGEAHELCRWTVDLSALPNFMEVAQADGGYIAFDLGLELDSAEVRGLLISDDGIECGRASKCFVFAKFYNEV